MPGKPEAISSVQTKYLRVNLCVNTKESEREGKRDGRCVLVKVCVCW